MFADKVLNKKKLFQFWKYSHIRKFIRWNLKLSILKDLKDMKE